MNVGKISKYNIERLGARNVELRFDCPYCGSARIGIKYRNQMDFWDGIVCPKCKSRVILDNLSLTVVHAVELKEESAKTVTESMSIS
jgi:DNA-directed RNA polymerase subunit RPC12/RpoP